MRVVAPRTPSDATHTCVLSFVCAPAAPSPPRSPPPGSGAVVFAFSTTDRESFLAVENWKRKVDEECGDIPCVLVQNKIDMLAQAQVDPYVFRRMFPDS